METFQGSIALDASDPCLRLHRSPCSGASPSCCCEPSSANRGRARSSISNSSGLSERLKPRPRLVELIEIVEVPLPDSVAVMQLHDNGRGLKRSFRFAPHPSGYPQRPSIIEGEDVVHAQSGVGSEIDQRLHARHIFAARAQREEPNGAMVLD